MTHLDEEQLTDAYYGNLDAKRREHLASCAECRLHFARLQEQLDSLRDYPIPERSASYGAEVWARLAPRLPQRNARLRWLRWWMMAPAIAAAVVLAFVAGMLTQHRLEPGFSAAARERVLLVALSEHLERSEILVTELLNARSTDAVLRLEQERARDLVDENRLLRQTALHLGNAAYSGLLDDLERLLLNVANCPGDLAPEELHTVQQRIESEGLLFKLRITSADARRKEQNL